MAGDPCPDPPGVDPIGTFNCWGFSPRTGGGPGFVHQEFNLFDRGKIQLQGQEGPTSTLAVVGGTGDFVNVRGEVTRRDQSACTEGPNPPPITVRFTVDFDLIGADGDLVIDLNDDGVVDVRDATAFGELFREQDNK